MAVGIGVWLCSGCSGIGVERWASAFYAQEGVELGYVARGVQRDCFGSLEETRRIAINVGGKFYTAVDKPLSSI